MTTMVSNKIIIKKEIYVSSVLSRRVVVEPNRCLRGPRRVVLAAWRALRLVPPPILPRWEELDPVE